MGWGGARSQAGTKDSQLIASTDFNTEEELAQIGEAAQASTRVRVARAKSGAVKIIAKKDTEGLCKAAGTNLKWVKSFAVFGTPKLTKAEMKEFGEVPEVFTSWRDSAPFQKNAVLKTVVLILKVRS